MSKKYLEQYERVKRWQDRLKMINDGREHNLPSDYYQDEVFAFFVNCYHLKDWIKNDQAVKLKGKEIEDYVSNSEFLSICADICNGSKHLTITRSRTGSGAQMGGRNFFLNLGETLSLPIFKARYRVIVGKKTYDAFTLATKCIEDWEQFLKSKKLL